jgi:hypothetical protein
MVKKMPAYRVSGRLARVKVVVTRWRAMAVALRQTGDDAVERCVNGLRVLQSLATHAALGELAAYLVRPVAKAS